MTRRHVVIGGLAAGALMLVFPPYEAHYPSGVDPNGIVTHFIGYGSIFIRSRDIVSLSGWLVPTPLFIAWQYLWTELAALAVCAIALLALAKPH